MMQNKLLATLPLVGALMLAQHAQADTTINFSFSGGGVSGSGTLAYDSNPLDADPISGGNPITHITGTFSDTNIGISGANIVGLVPSTGNATPPAGTSPYPVAMSYFFCGGRHIRAGAAASSIPFLRQPVLPGWSPDRVCGLPGRWRCSRHIWSVVQH
jgi:hypothetical protein